MDEQYHRFTCVVRCDIAVNNLFSIIFANESHNGLSIRNSLRYEEVLGDF